MPIQAQSADGVTHEFPDGTDQAVIGKVMKDYALQNTKTAAPGYKFSDAAINSALKKPGTSTVWMKPDAYLSLAPELTSNPRTDKKGASLKKSLDKGDDVDEVPSLDVTVGKDGIGKVIDQDGRHRAQFAKDAGVDLIPVTVKRGGENIPIKTLAGMRDGSEAIPFDFSSVTPPPKAKPAAQGGPAAPKGAPRWDVLGDIGRAAEGAVNATSEDMSSALPGIKARQAQSDQNRKDYGLVGGVAKDVFVEPVKRMGSALRLPLDLAGIVLSPVTGAAHGIAGSALSYVSPRQLPAMQVTGYHPLEPGGLNPLAERYRKMVPVDPKEQADKLVDDLMMGLAPEKGRVPAGTNALTSTMKAQREEAILRNKAIDKVNQRAAEDGLTAQEVLDKQKAAAATGDKITLMDLGKKNVRGLAGAVHRAPGTAGAEIDDFLEARDKAVSDALTSEIHGGIAKGSTFNAMKSLFATRTAASKPAFDAAFAADSTAPFERQLEGHFNEADKTVHAASEKVRQANSDLTALEAKAATTSDVYSAPTPKALTEARAKAEAAQSEAAAADAQKEAVRAKLKQAQADKTANAPGAVWSPRLQEFMDNPEIQAGLKKALKLEKQDAVSERRPFKDSDFGIVGTDAEGEPVLGAVPTMKSLAVAKEGLDARIADLKDPITGRPTKAGLSLKKFRDEFVKELYRINPRYKTAVDAWSGPSQSVDAIKEGRTHFSRSESNEEVKADFDALTKSDKEFYRLGAAEAKIDALERSVDASDKTKRVINSERDRKRFRMLFDSDAAAQKFIESVERKRQMFDTKTAIKGGSHTAGRIAEDEHEGVSAGLHGAHAVANAASGNWLGAISSALRAKHDLGMINNPALNSEIARYLTDPNLQIAPSSGNTLLSRTPLPGVQNQLAKGIFRAAHVNGLRALTMPQAAAAQAPPSGQ